MDDVEFDNIGNVENRVDVYYPSILEMRSSSRILETKFGMLDEMEVDFGGDNGPRIVR